MAEGAMLQDRRSCDALMERVGRGDAAAFRQLYDATSPKLFGVIRRIVRERGVAEEVLQEVFLKVWQKASAYRPETGGSMSFMLAMARNAAIDRLRSREHGVSAAVAATDDADDVIGRLADEGGGPGDPLARRSLARCLEGLEGDARTAVVLAYVHGYSREELGERLGRPVGTVKTWLHRSLKALADCLGHPA